MVDFKDGNLVKGAYVVINGVEYPVHMPQYSGTTPISSANLNKIQEDLQEYADNLHKTNYEHYKFSEYAIREINPASASNKKNWGGSYYYKVYTKVHIHLALELNSTGCKQVFTMPVGYRPRGRISNIANGVSAGLEQLCEIEVFEDGTVWARNSEGTSVCVDIEYEAFS